jgi:hypothetical protein
VRYLDIKLAAKQAQRGFMTNCSTYASTTSSSLLAVMENNTTSLGSWFPVLLRKIRLWQEVQAIDQMHKERRL